MAKKDQIVVGLDIGTTKICVIIGEKNDEGQIEIIGLGTSPSRGLRKGVVVNIDSTVETIKKAVEEAELMAGTEVTSVYAGIAGGHIKSMNSRGVVAVKDREVNPGDVARVIDAARAISIPLDREVLHVFPQEYIVDDQDGIKDPMGMSGVRLEAEVHIVTGAVTSVHNIIKSCNRAGLEVKDIVLEPFASSLAVLTPEEKELGVALVDLGGGTVALEGVVPLPVGIGADLGGFAGFKSKLICILYEILRKHLLYFAKQRSANSYIYASAERLNLAPEVRYGSQRRTQFFNKRRGFSIISCPF